MRSAWTRDTEVKNSSSNFLSSECDQCYHILKCGHGVSTKKEPHSEVCSIECSTPKGADRRDPPHKCGQCFPKSCDNDGHVLRCGHFIKGHYYHKEWHMNSPQNSQTQLNEQNQCTESCLKPIGNPSPTIPRCPRCALWESEDSLLPFAEQLERLYSELGAHKYGCFRNDFDAETAASRIGLVNSEARNVCGRPVWNILQRQGPINFINHIRRREALLQSGKTGYTRKGHEPLPLPLSSNDALAAIILDDESIARIVSGVTDALSREIRALQSVHNSSVQPLNEVQPYGYVTNRAVSHLAEKKLPIDTTIDIVKGHLDRVSTTHSPGRFDVQAGKDIEDLNNTIIRKIATKSSLTMQQYELLVDKFKVTSDEEFGNVIMEAIGNSDHFLRFYFWIQYSDHSFEALSHFLQNLYGEAKKPFTELSDSMLSHCLTKLPKSKIAITERIIILMHAEPNRYKNKIMNNELLYSRIMTGNASLDELMDLEESIRLFDVQSPLNRPLSARAEGFGLGDTLIEPQQPWLSEEVPMTRSPLQYSAS